MGQDESVGSGFMALAGVASLRRLRAKLTLFFGTARPREKTKLERTEEDSRCGDVKELVADRAARAVVWVANESIVERVHVLV